MHKIGSSAKTLVFNFGLKPKPLELSLKLDVNKMANCLYFWHSCQQRSYLIAKRSVEF